MIFFLSRKEDKNENELHAGSLMKFLNFTVIFQTFVVIWYIGKSKHISVRGKVFDTNNNKLFLWINLKRSRWYDMALPCNVFAQREENQINKTFYSLEWPF